MDEEIDIFVNIISLVCNYTNLYLVYLVLKFSLSFKNLE